MDRTLKGSTLVETLVMMIVAGIVFLSVMDALGLFTRLQMRRMEQMQANSRIVDGYYRTESLISTADSVDRAENKVVLYRDGRSAQLSLDAEALVYSTGEFRDTLLGEVRRLHLSGDTVGIELPLFTIEFAACPRAVEQYATALERIEQGYGYGK